MMEPVSPPPWRPQYRRREDAMRSFLLAPNHSSSRCVPSFSLALLGYDLIRGERTRAERVRPENIPPGISASVLGYSVYRSAMDAGWGALSLTRSPPCCME